MDRLKDATANHGRVISDTIRRTNELGIAHSSATLPPASTVVPLGHGVGWVLVVSRVRCTSQDFVNWVCSDHRLRFLNVGPADNSAVLRSAGVRHTNLDFRRMKAPFRSRRFRTTRHRPRPRHAGRQDRAEPPDERDAGGHGAGALQVVVRRFRPRPRQDGGPRHRPASGDCRPLSCSRRRFRVGRDSGGLGRRPDPGAGAADERRDAEDGSGRLLGRADRLGQRQGRVSVPRDLPDRHRAHD